MITREKLLSLHRRAVKAAAAYEIATPQTRTKDRLFTAWQKAEDRFDDAARLLYIQRSSGDSGND